MKKQILEIERLDAEELIELIADRVSELINLSDSGNTSGPCTPCEERWLTSSEAMEALQISRPTLDNMRRGGKIKHVTVGRAYRYRLPPLNGD